MTRRVVLWLVVAFGVAVGLAPASRAPAQQCAQACALALRQSGDILPLGEIVVISGVIGMGEVLDTQLYQRNDTWLYGFRMLNQADNQVFRVIVDAKTGAIISN